MLGTGYKPQPGQMESLPREAAVSKLQVCEADPFSHSSTSRKRGYYGDLVRASFRETPYKPPLSPGHSVGLGKNLLGPLLSSE